MFFKTIIKPHISSCPSNDQYVVTVVCIVVVKSPVVNVMFMSVAKYVLFVFYTSVLIRLCCVSFSPSLYNVSG